MLIFTSWSIVLEWSSTSLKQNVGNTFEFILNICEITLFLPSFRMQGGGQNVRWAQIGNSVSFCIEFQLIWKGGVVSSKAAATCGCVGGVSGTARWTRGAVA